jgi:glycosyltransferase involved in cell wall biosynthesis
MNRGKIIVSVTNDLVTDNRVDKVCNFLNDNNFDVLLVGRKLPTSLPLSPRKYKVHRLRLISKKGALFYAEFNIRLFIFILFNKSKYLISNDLDTLLANYCASVLKRNKLFYDSHELYTEVPELVHRPRVKKIWESIEGWIFPKLNKIYTVNDAIAGFYKKKYKKEISVIRNIAPLWNPKGIKSRKELGLPEDKTLLIVQGAGINVDRGIEELVQAMSKVDTSCTLVIVGSGDVIETLKKLTSDNHLEDRVLFFGKRPYLEMMDFTAHASWGFSLDKDSNLNYRFSLPNKIFDYIQASTPIVCTDLIEVKKIVSDYQVGVFIPSHSPEILANFINGLLANKAQHATFVDNCKKAAQFLCWENEERKLKDIYEIKY